MNKGSILLESLVAITVLTVGLLGMFALLSNSIGLMRTISDRYTAAFLASEGIEVVKNIIDTNMLQGRQWNDGFDRGTYEVVYDANLLPDLSRKLLWNPGAHGYQYSDGVETNFRRTIAIERIGAHEVRANALVSWVGRGGAQFDTNVEEHFFDWQQ